MQLHARDSLVPFVAPEHEGPKRAPGAWELAARVASAGAWSGLVAGLVAGVPYYFAVRDAEDLPWADLAPRFFTFAVVTGAIYGAGAALGVHTLAAALHARREGALVAFVGASLGAALAGALPGAVGAAYFGSLPYPFVGATTLAVAPFVGAAPLCARLTAATREGEDRDPRSGMAAVVATVLVCIVGALLVAVVDDATMLGAFRSGVAATAGRADSVVGLAIVGAIAGALLGIGLGGQVGLSVALRGSRQAPKVTITGA